MNAVFPLPEGATPIDGLALSSKPKAARIFARAANEWYVEPERCTDQLLAVERFCGPVWDPCCGQGNILRALERAGVECVGTDLVRRVPEDLAHLFAGPFDFLRQFDPRIVHARPRWATLLRDGAINIAFNPPFLRAVGTERAIRVALRTATGKVCVFVEARFFWGAERAEGLFAEHPPARIYAITPRPSCPPGDYLAAGNKAGSGLADYIWIVWDRTAPTGDTRIGHLHRGHMLMPGPTSASAASVLHG